MVVDWVEVLGILCVNEVVVFMVNVVEMVSVVKFEGG